MKKLNSQGTFPQTNKQTNKQTNLKSFYSDNVAYNGL